MAVSQKILTILDTNEELELSLPSIDTASLSTSSRLEFCLYIQLTLSTCFAFSCILDVPFPLLEKLPQAAKIATVTVIRFSNVFSTKKVCPQDRFVLDF